MKLNKKEQREYEALCKFWCLHTFNINKIVHNRDEVLEEYPNKKTKASINDMLTHFVNKEMYHKVMIIVFSEHEEEIEILTVNYKSLKCKMVDYEFFNELATVVAKDVSDKTKLAGYGVLVSHVDSDFDYDQNESTVIKYLTDHEVHLRKNLDGRIIYSKLIEERKNVVT